MYGQEEISYAPRVFSVGMHVVFVAIAAWLYFGGGIQTVGDWFGVTWTPGPLGRRLIHFAFALIVLVRMSVTMLYLLKRRYNWSEAVAVVFALAIYQVGFAILGARQQRPIDILDVAAVALFLLGSYLNTGSEFQRKRFKDNPANRGKLYTQGLFHYARHINYFGDVLWVTAWAIVTRVPEALIIPALLLAGFVFGQIPALSKHLAERYGEQYTEWAKTTKKLVPYIY